MAISLADEFTTPLFTFTAEDTDADATDEIIDSTSGTFYTVYVDNSSNSGDVYVKLWNNSSAANITVGTTNPDWIFPVPASSTKQFCFPDGFAYSAGLVMACVTSPGTEGTTGPTNDVLVRIGLTT
jgi:hypothetical protein